MVDTTVVTFPIICYRRWRSCTPIFSAGVSQRRECLVLPQAVRETPEELWWRAAYCCFIGEIVLRYVF